MNGWIFALHGVASITTSQSLLNASGQELSRFKNIQESSQ